MKTKFAAFHIRLFGSETWVLLVALFLRSAAGAQDLPTVAPEKIPMGGTFYSLQNSTFPPLSFFPFRGADVPVFLLDEGNKIYLMDDQAVDYVSLAASAASPIPGEGSGGGDGTNAPTPAYAYTGCGFWLEIQAMTNPTVRLTVHNTVTGRSYTI